MISLKSLIPEIKIQPNKLEPKLDQVYNINTKWLFDAKVNRIKGYELVKIDKDSLLLQGIDEESSSKIIISYNQFIEGLKTKNIIEI